MCAPLTTDTYDTNCENRYMMFDIWRNIAQTNIKNNRKSTSKYLRDLVNHFDGWNLVSVNHPKPLIAKTLQEDMGELIVITVTVEGLAPQHHTVYPKKYAHGFCFAVLCCGYTLTDFPISIRLTSLALWQSNDCPSASKATLMNMDKYFMWIHYERLHNHNKAKHNKTVCIFLGIHCMAIPRAGMTNAFAGLFLLQKTSSDNNNATPLWL